MLDAQCYATLDSPIGQLHLAGSGAGLSYLGFQPPPLAGPPGSRVAEAAGGPLAQAIEQLTEYFSGARQTFELALDVQMTPFQRRVLAAVRGIPYGHTRSYGEIARAIGAPGAARAVGRANRDNPVAIVIPCHRVVGAGGRLTGYAGGLDSKAILLDLEQARAHAA